MTSVCGELGSDYEMGEFMDLVTERFARTFELEPVEDAEPARVT
jgi:hypothetical protein